MPFYSSPRLGIDGAGNVWLSYRQKLFAAFGTPPGTNWITVACRLEGGQEGGQWSPPIDLHHSDGLLDSRPVLLPYGSGLLALTNTDNRYCAPGNLDNQIYMSVLSLPPGASSDEVRRAAEDDHIAVGTLVGLYAR